MLPMLLGLGVIYLYCMGRIDEQDVLLLLLMLLLLPGLAAAIASAATTDEIDRRENDGPRRLRR